MKCSLVSIASTAGLLLLVGTPAWADPTPTPDVQWTYNFTPNQNFVSAAAPGTGTLTFTNEPAKGATNNSDVVLTNLKVSSTAPNDAPDKFNNTAWSGTLTLTDNASNASKALTFSGMFNGTFSGGDPTKNIGGNANVTNTFTSLSSYSWTAPNGNQYTITLGNFTPPGPPTASNAGSISVHVAVTPGNGTISGGGAPEPSTLLLSCLGLGFASAASWRKRQRAAKRV
jgi:hypothetical protein